MYVNQTWSCEKVIAKEIALHRHRYRQRQRHWHASNWMNSAFFFPICIQSIVSLIKATLIICYVYKCAIAYKGPQKTTSKCHLQSVLLNGWLKTVSKLNKSRRKVVWTQSECVQCTNAKRFHVKRFSHLLVIARC